MTTIYKYELKTSELTELEIPAGAKVLHVNLQHGHPMLWAMVDTHAPLETRTFCVYGTGHTIPEKANVSFINTFFVDGGTYVFHAFELLK